MNDDGPLATYVERVQTALVNEFQGCAMPVARINYFAIYQACMQTMRKLSDANHDKDPGYICKCPAEICLKECDWYLKKCLTNTRKSWPVMEHRDASDSCLKYLLEEFGGRSVEEFLWDVSLRQ